MGTFTGNRIHDATVGVLDRPFFKRNGYTESPLVIQCYLTLRCGFSCPHCLAASQDSQPPDMSMELIERLFDQASRIGVKEILLTGGEPLHHPTFPDVVDRLRSKGLNWSLNTAVCPTEEQRDTLVCHPPTYVAVSLDGPPEVHNTFRGSPEAFGGARDAIRFFAAIPNVTVCAGTTLTTVNVPHLGATYSLVREIGAHRWGIHLLIPEGRAHNRKDLFPTRSQLRKTLEFVAGKRREFPVSLCDEMGFAGEWEPLVRSETFFCAAGRAMCAILPDGSVMPCSTLDSRHSEGNLLRDSLTEIWNHRFQNQRNAQPLGKCAHCKDWMACGSGCWLQRTHNTQCFKHLWRISPAFKAAAGLTACVGSLSAQTVNAPLLQVSDQTTATMAITTAATSVHTSMPSVPQVPMISSPITVKGIYASKAGDPNKRTNAVVRQAVTRALQWMKEKQSTDGSWGEPDNKIMLTSLALLAFLSHGDLANCQAYQVAVEKGLSDLLRRLSSLPEDHEMDYRTEAMAVWCLADAYAQIRVPQLKAALSTRLTSFRKENASMWRPLALAAIRAAKADAPTFIFDPPSMPAEPQSSTNDFCRRVAKCLHRVQTHGIQRARTELDSLRLLDVTNWLTSSEPWLCALLTKTTFTQAGVQDRLQWEKRFCRSFIINQVQSTNSNGWWTAGSCGARDASETTGMTDADKAVYVTAIVTLCLEQYQYLEAFTPPRPDAKSSETNNIMIDVGEI